jgi:peptidoglycan/LPS O-acetylase OafA/YrhL
MLRQGEIKCLTGLRGIAACLVMLYHFFQDVAGIGRPRTFLLHGYLAVDLFFVLSGFVMALTYAETFAGDFSRGTYLGFLYKRLGRIYPLYIVVTLAMAALAYAGRIDQTPPSAGTVLSNLLLVQAWGFADSIGGPTWSISTEFAAYLLFPILVAATLSASRARLCAAAVAALALLVLAATRTPVQLHQSVGGIIYRNGPLDVFGTGTLYLLLRCLAGFILGLLAFRIATIPAVWRLAGKRFAAGVTLAIVAVLMLVPGSDIAVVLMFVPLVVALATERSLASRLLQGGVVYWLGLVSYSIYLVHRPLEDLLRKPIMAGLAEFGLPHPFTISGFVLIALVLTVSAASYYGIEKPARDWSRKLIRRRPRDIAAATAIPRSSSAPRRSPS